MNNKILNILLKNINKDGNKSRQSIIAYCYKGNELIHAVNSYSKCCNTSRKCGHYFDHAETLLVQKLITRNFIPKTIYIIGVTQGGKILPTTIPCDKCYQALVSYGVKHIQCLKNYNLCKMTI